GFARQRHLLEAVVPVAQERRTRQRVVGDPDAGEIRMAVCGSRCGRLQVDRAGRQPRDAGRANAEPLSRRRRRQHRQRGRDRHDSIHGATSYTDINDGWYKKGRHVIAFEDQPSDSPLVERIWTSYSERAGEFHVSTAAPAWIADRPQGDG